MEYKEKLDLDAMPKGFGLGNKYRAPWKVVGFDTETNPATGEVFTAQFSSSTGEKEVFECHGQPALVRDGFARLLKGAPPRSFILAGAHYLRFDISVLFKDTPEIFSELGEIAHEDEGGVLWKGSTNWPVIFAIARWGGRCLLLIDTFRWFPGSLADVCDQLQLPIRKLDRPKSIMENRLPREDEYEAFLDYAMVDADAALGVLKKIDSIWESEAVGPCISLAHQAGRIFRRNYTRGTAGKPVGLDAPDPFAQHHGVSAYHGGRNSLKAAALPLVVDNCTMYDVRSLYPHICSNVLPSFFAGRWVWTPGDSTSEIPDVGIYEISGELSAGDCAPYRLLMDAKGNYLPLGQVRKVWVTGFEVNEALRRGMLARLTWFGFYWSSEDEGEYSPDQLRRGGKYSRKAKKHPFREFYKETFARKEANRDVNPTLYTYYKNLANSLTGKFVSTIPRMVYEGDQRVKIRTPGMLFNGPVGAFITGAGRVELFREEVRCQSIHGATDSLMVPPGAEHPTNVGPAMGQFEKVCQGTFVCGRNKLYAVLGPEDRGRFESLWAKGFSGPMLEKGKKVKAWRGREILKYATHAFQGTVYLFLDLVFSGERGYEYTRMVQMRESQRRQGLTALTMTKFKGELQLGGKYGPQGQKG